MPATKTQKVFAKEFLNRRNSTRGFCPVEENPDTNPKV
jgi:hypothetical protein